jgi:hypothetical protein
MEKQIKRGSNAEMQECFIIFIFNPSISTLNISVCIQSLFRQSWNIIKLANRQGPVSIKICRVTLKNTPHFLTL